MHVEHHNCTLHAHYTLNISINVRSHTKTRYTNIVGTALPLHLVSCFFYFLELKHVNWDEMLGEVFNGKCYVRNVR